MFPGSFDPLTLGHYDMVQRALEVFDRVHVAIGQNAEKQTLFPLESRLAMARDVFASDCRVHVESYEGLTAMYCMRVGAQCMIRGLRSALDFEYEKTIAQANCMVSHGVDTLFLMARAEHGAITSTVVRDLVRHGFDTRPFLPPGLDLSHYARNA